MPVWGDGVTTRRQAPSVVGGMVRASSPGDTGVHGADTGLPEGRPSQGKRQAAWGAKPETGIFLFLVHLKCFT